MPHATRSSNEGRTRTGLEALLLCFALGACGNFSDASASRAQEAIFGGTYVAEGEWENVVALPNCTGVLVAATLVLYAAHCGTNAGELIIGADIRAPRRRVALDGCRAHPDAGLGNGRDVAYCVVAEPIADVPKLELLREEETRAVQAGTPVTQVGYGIDGELGHFGVKRLTTGRIESLGDDFVVTGVEGGTCSGDSGGPALVRLDPGDGSGLAEWRLLGLLSAGTSRECAISTDHYTNVRAVQRWVESETGVDLSGAPAAADLDEPGASSTSGNCAFAPPARRERLPFGVAGIASGLAAGAVCRRRRARGLRALTLGSRPSSPRPSPSRC